ncbi:unnamed protein product [Ostreobium quekettii]|uniref:Glutathione S-transferase 3, mitochondrial n=1 Tax=Ostreobium quekettii TaxID=121088 RepID=A0A8S1ILE9_9CHLO|nr:unnamed protein product [Ostreobium quekettii]|eukprot:evm.model.scf_253EXC.13 EVM.evm.TU.scf_253EXC.13   scf_253EXC:110317-111097(-)
MAIELQPEYGYVIASIAATNFVVQYMAGQVGAARKRYGVPYPKMYMEGDSYDARTFNCIQRVHQNTAESAPLVMVTNAVLGVVHPITASVLMAAYLVGRLVYSKGYSTGRPKNRMPGVLISWTAWLASACVAVYAGIARTGMLSK